PAPARAIEATAKPRAEGAAQEARARFDDVGQARALLLVERVMDLGAQAHERAAQPLDRGVVARVELAESDLVEARLAERGRDVAARLAQLAAELGRLGAELLGGGDDHALLRGRRLQLVEHAAHHDAAAEPARPLTEVVVVAEVDLVVEGRVVPEAVTPGAAVPRLVAPTAVVAVAHAAAPPAAPVPSVVVH